VTRCLAGTRYVRATGVNYHHPASSPSHLMSFIASRPQLTSLGSHLDHALGPHLDGNSYAFRFHLDAHTIPQFSGVPTVCPPGLLIAPTSQSKNSTDDERAPPRPLSAAVANKKRRRSMKATLLRELAHKDDEDDTDGSIGSAAVASQKQAAARARSLGAAITTAADASMASAKTGKAGAEAPPAAPPASAKWKNQAKAASSTNTKRKSQAATPSSAKKDKGKGPIVDPNELSEVALTLAVRRAVTARTLALLSNPEDAEDVYL